MLDNYMGKKGKGVVGSILKQGRTLVLSPSGGGEVQ